MPRAERGLTLRHALALGLLQGPAELLPISSSAHTSLVSQLAGWPYFSLGGERRKAFEVALHLGAGAALAIDMRAQLRAAAGELDGPRAGALALALAPPALFGALLRAPIERRLGGPRSIAAGLAGGGLAMALADVRAARSPRPRRRCAEFGPSDGLWLGLAQASALVPGVSRNGATLTAARARGFARAEAERLSWLVGLPVLLGANLLTGPSLVRDRGAGGGRSAAAVGGVAAFASTLVSARLIQGGGGGQRSLVPYAAYRCLLAGLVLRGPRRRQ